MNSGRAGIHKLCDMCLLLRVFRKLTVRDKLLQVDIDKVVLVETVSLWLGLALNLS